MKRPAVVTTTAVAQSIVAVMGVAIAIYLLVLRHSPDIRGDKDAPEIIKGLVIAAAVVGSWGVLGLVVSAALWTKRRWGWWLALVFNASTAALILSDTIGGSTGRKFSDAFMYFWRNFEDWFPALIFIAIVVVLLLPSVRRFYCGLPPTTAVDKPPAALASERQ